MVTTVLEVEENQLDANNDVETTILLYEDMATVDTFSVFLA
jgi:hypothetical protein